MPQEPLGKRSKQRAILRAVYEENLRIKENRPAERADRSSRHRFLGQWPVGTIASILLTGFVVLLASFVYQSLAADEEAARDAAPTRPAAVAANPFISFEEEALPSVPGSDDYELFLTSTKLPIARLFDLQVKTIVIDPGHGGRDPGAVGHLGAVEKDVTLDVARRLRERLEMRHGYRILLTREWDEEVALKDRVSYANAHEADLFVSVHVNYLPVEPVTAIETYFFGAQADDAALALAERENRDSEYSMAEFKELIQKIGNTVKLQESKRLAGSIQKSLYRNIRRINRDVSDWGVKSAPFVVLLGVEAPAVLAEIAVISNREEEAKLSTGAYRERLAAFLEEGIVHYLQPRPHTNESIDGATQDASEEE